MWCDLNEAFGEGNNTFKKDWKHFVSHDDESTTSKFKNNINDDIESFKSK